MNDILTANFFASDIWEPDVREMLTGKPADSYARERKAARQRLKEGGEWPRRRKVAALLAARQLTVISAHTEDDGSLDREGFDRYLRLPRWECLAAVPSLRAIDEWLALEEPEESAVAFDYLPFEHGMFMFLDEREGWSGYLIYNRKALPIFKKEDRKSAKYWVKVRGEDYCLNTSAAYRIRSNAETLLWRLRA